uniref:Uncharacterized protein n=1 Tax=Glossina pallidipes TaxID=7398 RepID=A0A1A9ZBM6_GLOPL
MDQSSSLVSSTATGSHSNLMAGSSTPIRIGSFHGHGGNESPTPSTIGLSNQILNQHQQSSSVPTSSGHLGQSLASLNMNTSNNNNNNNTNNSNSNSNSNNQATANISAVNVISSAGGGSVSSSVTPPNSAGLRQSGDENVCLNFTFNLLVMLEMPVNKKFNCLYRPEDDVSLLCQNKLPQKCKNETIVIRNKRLIVHYIISTNPYCIQQTVRLVDAVATLTQSIVIDVVVAGLHSLPTYQNTFHIPYDCMWKGWPESRKKKKQQQQQQQQQKKQICWTKRDLHVMVKWSVFLLCANILNIKLTRGQRDGQFALKLLDFPVVPNSFLALNNILATMTSTDR